MLETIQKFWWIGGLAFLFWVWGVRSGTLGALVVATAFFFPALALLAYIRRKAQR